jgi:hypothetical protein
MVNSCTTVISINHMHCKMTISSKYQIMLCLDYTEIINSYYALVLRWNKTNKLMHIHLLILQSSDWLAAFHLDLLPFFSLLYNCQLLCIWRLALSTIIEIFPRPFFLILLHQGCLLQTHYA